MNQIVRKFPAKFAEGYIDVFWDSIPQYMVKRREKKKAPIEGIQGKNEEETKEAP